MRKRLPPLTNCVVELKRQMDETSVLKALRATGVQRPERFAFPIHISAEIKDEPNVTEPSVSPSMSFHQVPIYITTDCRRAYVYCNACEVVIWKVVSVRRRANENYHALKAAEIRRLREMYAYEFGCLKDAKERARRMIAEIRAGGLDRVIQNRIKAVEV